MQACWAGHAGELGWVAPVYKVRRCRRTGTAEERGSLAVMSERPVADVWRCITGVNVGVAGESVLVAARSRASSGEVSPGEASVALACSRRRQVLAVACASVVRHGAGVLAPPTGAGCGVRFGRPSWRWRARAADGGWLYSEGSIRSGRFHPIDNKQCGGIGASRPRQHGLCVAWHLPSGTIGARSNAKPAPGTRRTASCDVRECCTAAPGGFKHGRLACPASDGRVSGARQARAARVPWV